jgi:hypothetical protein
MEFRTQIITSLYRIRPILGAVVLGLISLNSTSAAPTCNANQIGGTVYRDYDSDGAKDSLEPGIPSIAVRAYDSSGTLLSSTTTSSSGEYNLSVSSGLSARVEFDSVPSYLKPGFHGADSVTSVSFVTNNGASCDIDLALNNPAQYCQNDPLVGITCFNSGDPLAGGNAGAVDSVVAFPYSANGQPSESTAVSPNHLAIASQTGTVWGVAWQRSSKVLFTSAFLRRFAGFGPLGTGGIYKIDYSNLSAPVVSQFVNLQSIGINTGEDPRVTSGQSLPASSTIKNRADSLASQLIAKNSLGDLEISEDEKYLWFVNQHDKKIYRLFIDTPATVPDSLDVTSYTITSSLLNCSNDEYVPWGLGIKDGLIYVGVVCTAQTSNLAADLKGIVLTLDPSTASFTALISFALNHPRGTPGGVVWPVEHGNVGLWNPWVDSYDAFAAPAANGRSGHPQPVISDIEFDDDGSLLIALLDRYSISSGFAHRFPPPHVAAFTSAGISAGDLLRVCYNSSTGSYVLENNASCPGAAATAGAGNNQGPGGGEYFVDQDSFNGGHNETPLGALALKPGDGKLLATVFDPFTINSAGVKLFGNSSGVETAAYEVFINDGADGFGKSSSLGDIELLCDQAPLEIGNRVWIDSNRDGLQDPSESPVVGATVTLINSSTGAVVATTVTDSNGQYYFSVSPNTAYSICLQTSSDFASGGALSGLILSSSNQGSKDGIDTDASYVSGKACISITTGTAGESNHTLDMGFVSGASVTDLTSTQLSIDTTAKALADQAKRAVNLRARGQQSGGCDSLTESKRRSLVAALTQIENTIWNKTWGLYGLSYTFSGSTPNTCSTVDQSSEISSLLSRAATLRSRARSALKSCNSSYKKKILEKVDRAYQIFKEKTEQYPQPVLLCGEAR